MITQEQVRKLFNYNPTTGLFTRKEQLKKYRKTKSGISKGCGYYQITISGKTYTIHRLIWIYLYGEIPPKMQIDHINRTRDDNRLSNLRLVTRSQNFHNKTISRNNTSGVTGVHWHAVKKKWYAQIMINRKHVWLGYFKKKEEAIKARKEANKIIF